MKKRWIVLVTGLMTVLALLIGCASKDQATEKKIVIAEQFGLAYAPLQVMQAKGFLEASLPDYEIEWVKLGNTAAIREAILADALDVGFLGIPPFLIGYGNGMDWGIFTGLSSAPLGLVTSDPSITTLDDIRVTDRIALPQPGSIQHILLSMAAEQTFGQADYFDQQLVTMKHPDGMNALLSGGDVTLHFTSPPYLFEELAQPNLSQVIDGTSCFGGEFTFIVGMTTQTIKQDGMAFEALKGAVADAIAFMDDHPEETVAILSDYYDYDEATLEAYVYERGINYSTEVLGLERFIEFMTTNGLLEKPIEAEAILW
ncbi:MAG: ABC transporter substrate-binding protein [Clostridia bacterium]|nr:ABC transporter substrate-binding protein [Clostridia bacterium]